MNKNFLKFIETKGYNENSFDELEAEKKVEIQRDYLGNIEEQLKNTASKTEVTNLGDAINELKDQIAKNIQEPEVNLVDEFKANKGKIKSIVKGDVNIEVVLKANTTRASIVNNTESVRLGGIGQLGLIKRALYDVFPKVQVGNGNHNGTISYVDWNEETIVRAADIVAEGGTYDESTAGFTEYTKKLQKIGDILPVTEEFLEDEVLASSELNKFLEINVNSKIDTKIAVGAGGSSDIEGLYTAAPAYTPVASSISDANIKDLVRKMRTKIVKTRGSKYSPNIVVANSDTIDTYILKKDGENNYMFDSQTGTIAGLTIVEDNNLADNTLIVGDSRFGTIYEKAGVILSEGYSGNNNFEKDIKTLKARVRLLFLIRNVDKTGFLKCTNINAALATLASAPTP